MAFVAIANGLRVIAPFMSDEDWKITVKLAKARQVTMVDTGLPAQAKTRRSQAGITRFFSHFPGEAPDGYAGSESPEHAAMKLAVFCRLRDAGFEVTLEAGHDDWRADVLVGPTRFGTALAVEIQLSTQSAEATYLRTAQRAASGVPTLWIFGTSGSTGHLGVDLLQKNPIFTAKSQTEAAGIALDVCNGSAFFDDLSLYAKTPARPIAFRVPCSCGQAWLYPIGLVLLLNRIRADLDPLYVSASLKPEKRNPKAKAISKARAIELMQQWRPVFIDTAKLYGLRLGRALVSPDWGVVWERTYRGGFFVRRFIGCPWCKKDILTYRPHLPWVPKGIDVDKAPTPIVGEYDARSVLKIQPVWLRSRPKGRKEPVMSEDEWRRTFILPMRQKVTPPSE